MVVAALVVVEALAVLAAAALVMGTMSQRNLAQPIAAAAVVVAIPLVMVDRVWSSSPFLFLGTRGSPQALPLLAFPGQMWFLHLGHQAAILPVGHPSTLITTQLPCLSLLAAAAVVAPLVVVAAALVDIFLCLAPLWSAG